MCDTFRDWTKKKSEIPIKLANAVVKRSAKGAAGACWAGRAAVPSESGNQMDHVAVFADARCNKDRV